MDQPQQNNDDQAVQGNNDEQGNVEQTQSSDTSYISNPDDNSDQGTDTFINDPVMEGVPSGEASPENQGVNEASIPSLAVAEDAVENAEPVPVADELAQVANEIESLVTSGESVEDPVQDSLNSTEDNTHDPMQQIISNQEAADQEEGMGHDLALGGYDTNGEQKSDDQASSDIASSDEGNYTEPPTAAAQVENEQPVNDSSLASVEQTVPENTETVEDMPSDENITPDIIEQSVNDPVVESINMESSTEPIENNDTQVTTELVPAPEPSTNPTPTIGTIEPNNSGGVISDVIAPSAVAAAAAIGTAGQNAITGTPESSTIESSQGAMLANQKEKLAKKPKNSKIILIIVVCLVTILFAGGIVAAYFLSKNDTKQTSTVNTTPVDDVVNEDPQSAENQEPTKTPLPGEKVEAKALDDYKAACASGGLVTNSSDYIGASPHPVVTFEKGSDDKYALSLVAYKDKAWTAVATKVDSVQLVVCMARKAGSETKIKSCPITDSVTKVTADVDLYSTKYSVDVIEAKSGKKVTSFENSSISATCPTNAVYNKSDPKIFAGYDLISLEESLNDPITKAL